MGFFISQALVFDSYLDLGWLQDSEAVTTPLMTFTYDIVIGNSYTKIYRHPSRQLRCVTVNTPELM